MASVAVLRVNSFPEPSRRSVVITTNRLPRRMISAENSYPSADAPGDLISSMPRSVSA